MIPDILAVHAENDGIDGVREGLKPKVSTNRLSHGRDPLAEALLLPDTFGERLIALG